MKSLGILIGVAITMLSCSSVKKGGDQSSHIVDHNIAQNKPITASSYEDSPHSGSFPPAFANDGYTETRWASGHSDDQWLLLDLEAPVYVDSIVIHWQEAHPIDYTLSTAIDTNKTWSAVYASKKGIGGRQVLHIKSTIRYFKFVGRERRDFDGTKWGYSINDLEAFSKVNSATIPHDTTENMCAVDLSQYTTIDTKVSALLSCMSLTEKIGQMSQARWHSDLKGPKDVTSYKLGSIIHTAGAVPGTTVAEWQQTLKAFQEAALKTRLKIPLLIGVDAIHGQNTFDGAVIFPHNIGLGATRNTELVEEIAKVTAIESQATGFNWVFSPCIAIPYNEKWGRVYEGFSEDTQLTSKLTAASIRGHQGASLASSHTVLATAKHFIGDGSTDDGKEGGMTSLSMQEISERLLPPYRTAVSEGVGAIMVGFNSFEDMPMHRHKTLVTDTLKKSMNFNGIVITDWKGYSKFGNNRVINAGVDVAMATGGTLGFFQSALRSGVMQKEVPMNRIDDAVRRVLTAKFKLGLFENPFADTTLIPLVGSKKHRDVARQAVRESLVLLKNKNILPLKKSTKKIVVVGEHANNSGLQAGGWSVDWQGNWSSWRKGPVKNVAGAHTILDGIMRIAKGTVVYDSVASDPVLDADLAVIVVGETPYAESFGDYKGEGGYTLNLTPEHQKYINTYAGKMPIVVILISGRPLITTDEIKKSDAFIAAWLPGSEGDGVAEILFGEHNFTGKLPHSWPGSMDDFKGAFGPNYWDNSTKPLFPFGYGLQYR